jgi:hypothetical protein
LGEPVSVAVAYNETDLTEAAKIISYFRSIRVYAVTIACLCLFYAGFKLFTDIRGTELYLIAGATGVLILGSLSIIVRLNYRTATLYGASSIIAGGLYSFSALYYQGDTGNVITTIAFIAGLIVMGRGATVAFGRRSRNAFSRENQKKVSFIINLLKSLKQSRPNEKNIIHCTYTDDGKKSNVRITLLDNVACFLFEGQSVPVFFDRANVYIFELQANAGIINVSITAHSHDWIEAQFTPADFKKYQIWKDL